ncbi:NAD(P)-dependent oxidoreductase [Azospirillum brasilense]|uniref:Glutamate synthase [NADPH] small chain n=3 Tax=Azospirillum brasilense TaxID=192 RepID=GLTD_AZOBR|nr:MULTISPECIES: NAD(P)-dependent oxidoreductase [Azospirillum]Q05756.3 RecName: Full=Glutamate synthase [NADPH] small chain; AltName: Full=Glutamate synthase subunit beta; Short=GLTS beta chain; AltName: Full=NADPH-GOGAT [Azospirillum brasilense]6S6S_E Chain E, Glutamate synthase [NADPH] small chain [Azospirillum brasilense]6S6S_F Chain F, Glutamate synthase [NADPH] small chain [Azospirillum brasilense]6S6S_G Chain G, Glutamate synthase [NADPH] small chain [Azospirillum brasilense]6S6S_H Chai
MANQRMLGFVHTAQRMPDKRPAAERRQDFAEIYARFSDERANEQANRCSQCGVPFCQVHCPVSNNIPDWLKLTSEGRLEEAYEVSQATNNFPEICGRICPQDRLCEGNCVIEQSTHGAVTIGSVEKYINDTAWDQGWVKPRTPSRELGLSVGVIGAGPAGLAAAEELRAKGYEVHVYDRYDRMGGLLVYGIPGFKLEKSVVERRVKLLADAGVIYHPNFEVGRDASLPELRRKHVAVLVATGVYKARDIKAPGSGLGNIVAALDYLTTSNKVSLGDTVEAYENGSLNAAGKHVVVLGGGDTAMDCVRTAIRQGATSVKCLYRRDRKNMPGSQREVAHAEEEGVEFIWQAAPEGFTGDTVVTGVRAVRIHLGVADATGRQTPQVIEGSEFTVQADLVIKALGFEPEDLPNAFDEPELKVTRWGTLLVDHRTKMTNMDGVFAAGDIVRGASLVVWAIRDGRDAAEGIHAYAKAKAEAPVAVAAE